MSDVTNPAAAGSALSLPEAVKLMGERRQARAAAAAQTAADPESAHDDEGTGEVVAPAAAAESSAGEPQPAAAPADPPQPPPGPATIDIDGVTVPVEEVRRGYMRQSDYTRKTQDLAEAVRAAAAERQVKLDRLNTLIQSLAAEQAREPDWVAVAQADPLGWAQKKALWDRRQAALRQARQFVASEEAAALRRNRAAMADELRERYNPAWRDQARMMADLDAVERYALAEGYTPAELSGIDDPRYIRTLDKARRWDELQRQRPHATKRVVGKPAVQRPGAKAATGAAQARGVQAAWERFLKNPSVENGVAYQRAKREAGRAAHAPEPA